jgi:signal transduction histidine kinase
MNTKNKKISHLRFILTSLLTASTLVLLIILASIIYITEKQGKEELEKNTLAWANSLAKITIPYLQQNQESTHKKLKSRLSQLITSPDINYVHVYKKSQDNKISYFSGFNKNVYFPSIPNKIDTIEQLSHVRYQSNYVELVVKIEQDETFYGYLYIQYSNKTLEHFISKLIFIALSFFITCLICFALLAVYVNRKIKQPITTIIDSVKIISQKKDFSHRIDNLSFIELDVLARTINLFLDRTESHIEKQNNIHQHALQQNANLSEKVNARTNALKQSNQELLSTLEKLHQFQGQLVETEKMASLGEMVAGISHEINTPIGLGVTASTLLADRLKQIKKSFEDQTLKSSQLKKFLIEGEENIGVTYRNLDRAAKLISSFKKVAVNHSNTEIQQFNISELLDEVILTLKEKTKQCNIDVIVECPKYLIIESSPDTINQIILNLIMNSIIHGFEHRHQGIINISISHLSDQLFVTYQDNGVGIDENIKSKVFDPFTTTKRGSGGSGLGLHLVFNLVTQALNGHIDFESDALHGTLFNITFPVILVLIPNEIE